MLHAALALSFQEVALISLVTAVVVLLPLVVVFLFVRAALSPESSAKGEHEA